MLTDQFYAIAEPGHNLTLYILLILSVLSIGFILERFMALRQIKSKSDATGKRLREIIQSSDLSQIEMLGRDWESLEGRALSFGLRHVKDHGDSGLEELFDSFAATERPRLERFLNFLATVGSNAPFIGLLGTVFGLMDAFRSLALSQGDATAVMIGISKALVATAVGLLVAIPAVVAYNAFQKQVKSIFQNLEGVKDICLAYAKTHKEA